MFGQKPAMDPLELLLVKVKHALFQNQLRELRPLPHHQPLPPLMDDQYVSMTIQRHVLNHQLRLNQQMHQSLLLMKLHQFELVLFGVGLRK